MSTIKIGYLVSYDYELLYMSLQLLYKDVDEIYLAIDKSRKTWTGNTLTISEEFFETIKKIDTDKKIHIYEDEFYLVEMSPMELETRERNLLLAKMGKGWCIQLDADEYIYDFKILKEFLIKNTHLLWFPKQTPILFKGKLITLFKQTSEGFLYIDNEERFSFITNQKEFKKARNNDEITNVYIETSVIHQSWARSEEEIIQKIKNWGHVGDFDVEAYLKFWKQLSKENYTEFINIHPLHPPLWPKLQYMQADNLEEFINNYNAENPQKVRSFSTKQLIKTILRKK